MNIVKANPVRPTPKPLHVFAMAVIVGLLAVAGAMVGLPAAHASAVANDRAATTTQTRLDEGQSLEYGQKIVSQNGKNELRFSANRPQYQEIQLLRDGNLAWKSTAIRILMGADGNLYVFHWPDTKINLSHTADMRTATTGPFHVQVSDAGELEIRTAAGKLVWHRGTSSLLAEGNVMAKGQSISSPDGQTTLALTAENRLTLKRGGIQVWTIDNGADTLEMGHDGNCTAFFNHLATWTSGTKEFRNAESGPLELRVTNAGTAEVVGLFNSHTYWKSN